MATKNLKLTIINPSVQGLSAPIAFQKVANNGDFFRIPRRYPFVDISNYDALASAGYFRHGSKDVSSLLGGSSTTNTEGKLGFLLPQTEKLVLYVKRVATATYAAVAAVGAASEDTTVVEGKTYYTRESDASGAGYLNDGTYKYTKVASPTGNPATSSYYELSVLGEDGGNGTKYQKCRIKGSILYSIPDVEIAFATDSSFTTGERLYELNLFDFGLYISGIEGEDGISIEVDDKELEFALVARMA